MKKITSPYAFFILFFLVTAALFSQTGWVQQNSAITGNVTYIQAVDVNNALIGNPGYKTTNGGTTWFAASSNIFLEIQMINALTGYAVNNYLYKTTNGGLNWEIIQLGAPLYSQISFINENTGIVGGLHEYDYLDAYKTTNGGANWSMLPVANYSWPDYITEFTELKMLSASVMYVGFYVFQQLIPPLWTINYFKKSTNGGNWFSTMMWDSNFVFYETEFPAANIGFVVSAGGGSYRVIKSVNDNWGATVCLTTPYLISGIEFPSVNTGYAVGAGGMIHKTTNGGTNWYTLNTGTTRRFIDVEFINELTGWVVGDSGLILKTTTGGEVPVVHSISGIIRYQDNNDPVTSGYVKALRYDSVSHNIITVDSVQIQSNGAYTLPNCPPVWLDIMAYENDEDALSFVPTYHVSTINWQNSERVKPDSNLTNINIAVKRIVNPGDSMHVSGYVYTNNAVDYSALKDAIIYSRASGVFKSHSISLLNGYYCVDSLPSGVYELIVDRMGYVQESFVVMLTNSSLNNINFYLDDILVGINYPGIEIPSEFVLYQNYPNPFNPVTSIEFSIPEDSYSKLSIYDVLGREINVLVDQQLKRGVYRASWNAANHPSGVYFYKLETGDFEHSKKMMLVK
jgi:photosystem II stability/assembly factor-like uncharacterized protein